MKKNRKFTLKLVYSAVCLALAVVLPFLTASNMALGNMLCLMHIPVLLCGFLCGWPWGLAVGIASPLLRHLIVGMPPFPTCIAMACELGVYGFTAGFLYKIFPKKAGFIYLALGLSMLAGRVVNGAANLIITGVTGSEYTWSTFLTASFVTALPGIGIQIVLIPLLVLALKKAKLVLND